MNPTWQDLAEGWGTEAELQIPRFARDDSSLDGSSGLEDRKKSINTSGVTLLQAKSKIA
jgi:hypothetical protein